MAFRLYFSKYDSSGRFLVGPAGLELAFVQQPKLNASIRGRRESLMDSLTSPMQLILN
jgi:hypothetical protein